MSLRLKTILAIGLVEILVLMVLGYSTLSAMQRSILQEFDSRIKVTQQLVSGVAKEALIAFDLARLDGVVQELIKDPDIDYVGVSTNNNWISFSGEPVSAAVENESPERVWREPVVDTRAAVTEGGQAFGWVHIGFRSARIQSQLGEVQSRFAVIAVVGLLLSALLSYILGSWLSQRVMRLNDAADRLGRGDFGALVVDRGRDEFAMLSNSFNLMAARLRSEAGQREQAQQSLRDYSDQLDRILSLSEDGFIAFNSTQQMTYANPSAVKILGLEGQPDLDEFSRHLMAVADDWNLAVGDVADGQAYQIRVHRPTPRQVELVARRINPESDSPARVIYVRDVTHQKEVDRMKSEFLSTAAHELRTPLSSVYGFSELLLSVDYDPETRRELTETIHQQSARLTQLIDELLDLARIEARAGKDFFIKERDMKGFLTQLAERYMPPVPGRDLAIEWPDVIPSVAFDDNKLTQAVSNILNNAFKYSPEGGVVELSAMLEDSRVGIQVRDQGLGMSQTNIDHIFDRFYRADPSCNIPGSGLGMAVVKEIMDVHGGEIEIHSTLGEGTRVILWLERA